MLWYPAATAPQSQPSKTVPHGAPEGLVEAQLFDLGGGWTSLDLTPRLLQKLAVNRYVQL